MFSRMTPPRMAVQKGTLTWYSRSEPGSGPSCTVAPRPPNMPEKISLKPAAAGFAAAPAASFEEIREVEAAEINVFALTSRAAGLSARKPSREA